MIWLDTQLDFVYRRDAVQTTERKQMSSSDRMAVVVVLLASAGIMAAALWHAAGWIVDRAWQ